MQKLRLSIRPLADGGKVKIVLACAKCKATSPEATSGALMVLGWRRLRYHLAHNPVSCPICPACRKAVKDE